MLLIKKKILCVSHNKTTKKLKYEIFIKVHTDKNIKKLIITIYKKMNYCTLKLIKRKAVICFAIFQFRKKKLKYFIAMCQIFCILKII